MASLKGFNANDVEPAGDFSPVPPGEYVAFIVESDMKPTKNGRGEFLELKLQIAEGECQGRFVWDRLNLINDSEQAVQIAKGTLSSICRAVGHMTPNDSAELHMLPLVIKVVVEEWGDDGQKSNKVKAYKSRNPEPSAPTSPAPSQKQAQPTLSQAGKRGDPPWGKGKPPF